MGAGSEAPIESLLAPHEFAVPTLTLFCQSAGRGDNLHNGLAGLIVGAVAVLACRGQAPGANPPPLTKEPPSGGPCDSVDGTNLEETATCFYSTKSGAGLYRFLSSAAKADYSEDQVAEWHSPSQSGTDIEVAKQEVVSGNNYATVMFAVRKGNEDGGTRCTRTVGKTWVKVSGYWRRLGGDRALAELTRKKFKSGDFTGAVESAEALLKVDPLSMVAYWHLGFSNLRGATTKPRADIVRAVLSIAPKTSDALELAVVLTDDAEVRAAYLEQFRTDDCQLDWAVFNTASKFSRSGEPKAALALLDRYAVLDQAKLVLVRMHALGMLGKWKEAAALLDDKSGLAVRALLDSKDASFAASWSTSVATVLLAGGDAVRAREWVKYGLTKDPSGQELAPLLRKTKPKVQLSLPQFR